MSSRTIEVGDQTLPPYAYTYAVPSSWLDDYGIRRYGFHGTSHSFVSGQAARLLGTSRVLRESIGVAVPASERADHQAFEEQLRGALGPTRFEAEHRAGSRLDLDQVVTALV